MATKPVPDLIAAVFAKDLPGLNALLQKPEVDVNVIDRDGRTALAQAVIGGKNDFVEVLLAKGANPNVPDKLGGHVALHFAAQGWHVETVKRLLAGGAKIDVPDKFGNTPLARAVFESKGRGEVIQLLIKAGADKNHKNSSGVSP